MLKELRDSIDGGGISIEDRILAGEYTGVIDNLKAEVYRKAPGLSFSGLSRLEASPAHYQAYLHEERDPSDAMRIGTLTHRRILEPELFAATVACEPKVEEIPGALVTVDDLKKRLAELKLPVSGSRPALIERVLEADPKAIIWERYLAEIGKGKELITPADRDLIDGMADAVFSHSIAKEVFKNGLPEVSCFGVHEPTGARIKARFDWWRPMDGIIADLKTCRPDALLSERALRKHIYESRYHWQSALYLGLGGQTIGRKLRLFAHVFVGNRPTLYLRGKLTFHVEVKPLGDASLEKAEQEYTPLIEQYVQCERSGQWPGPVESIETIEIPDYAW